MAGRTAFDLEPDEIVDAAIAIFTEQGLDAVSMRNVSARLGVSPVPLYNRVGNKDALLDAMADRLLVDVAPAPRASESWRHYAERWAGALRDRLSRRPEIRLLISDRRSPFVEATRPLVDVLKANGFESDAAVQTCRLLIWAVVGFVVVEAGRARGASKSSRKRRPGGDPTGVTKAEADHLYAMHIGYILDGIERDR